MNWAEKMVALKGESLAEEKAALMADPLADSTVVRMVAGTAVTLVER